MAHPATSIHLFASAIVLKGNSYPKFVINLESTGLGFLGDLVSPAWSTGGLDDVFRFIFTFKPEFDREPSLGSPRA